MKLRILDLFGRRKAPRQRGGACRWPFPLGNTAITGDTGSAKTTGAGAHALVNALTHPDRPALLITCAKPSDLARYQAFLSRHGRAGPKVISPSGGHGLDPIRTLLRHPRMSCYAAERILSQVVRLADTDAARGDEQFWANATSECRLAALTTLWCAYGTADIRGVHAFIRDMPYGEEHKASGAYKGGLAYQAMRRAEERAHRGELTEAQVRQFLDAVRYVNVTFCGTEQKCRESIRMSALTGLGPFLAPPICDILDRDTVSPDDLQRGTDVVNGLGVIEYKAPGRLFACLLRMVCDEWLVARDPGTARPVVSWMDEAHLTLVPEDVRIATVCRESRLYQYRLFQTLPVAYDAVKGPHPEHLVAALYANHPYKVFHNTACQVTAKFASELCGERYEIHYGGSGNAERYDLWADLSNAHQGSVSCSWSEHKVPAVHPSVLGRLRRGGKADGFVADALVIEPARPHRFQSFSQIFV